MNIISVFEEYNIPFLQDGNHHCRDGWVQIDCPFCGRDSKRWHLGYNLSAGFFTCWRCGPHSFWDVLHEYHLKSSSIKEIKSQIQLTEIKAVEKKTGKLVLPKNITKMKKVHREYLQSRNLDPDEMEKLWNLQGIGLSSKLSWRIFIPIYFQGEIVSWTTRSISELAKIRYISASPEQEAINHKKILLGWDYIKNTVIITEGPFDVFRFGPGAVATFGTGFSKTQINRLRRIPKRVVVYDLGKEAKLRSESLLGALEGFPGETFRVTLDSDDLGSASEKEIKTIRRIFLE